jgi:hypothetical protein
MEVIMVLRSPKVFSAVHVFIIVLSLSSSPLAQTPRNLLGIHQTTAPEPQWTEVLWTPHVADRFFEKLGVEAQLGRVFTAGDYRPDAPRVVILSHKLWRNRFGADPAIIGRVISLDGKAHTVVGVMPEGFYSAPDLWTPHWFNAEEKYHSEEKKQAAEELEKNALALIDELVAEAMTLRLAENRVYVLTVMSDVLWARDEGRARALVRKAMDQVVAHMRELKEKATEEDWERFDSRYHHYMVSNLLAKRDAKLALDFLQQTRPLGPKERQRQQKNLEVSLASQIAESDSQTALRIAEEYLNSKLDSRVIDFWSELLRKDPKAASMLTRRIIANLKSQDILADYNLSGVVYLVVDVLRARVNEIADARNNPDATNATRLDSAEIQKAYRDALEIIVAAALKVTPAQLLDYLREVGRALNPPPRNLLTLVQTFLPEIEKHLPSRALEVRAKLAQFDEALNSLPAPQSPSLEDLKNRLKDLENTLENKSPDELIAMAESQEELKYALYIEAAGKLIIQGDTARARQILKDFLPDSAELERLRLFANEFFEAMKPFIARIEEKGREREWEQATKEGKLGEARIQVEARLSLAADSLNLDPNRGFEILGSAIDNLNTLSVALTAMNKFDQSGAPSLFSSNAGNSEMFLSDLSTINLATGLNERLCAFARKDINRTVALLNRLQVNEVRLMICLRLLNSILRA